jgi:hypothetical protein
VFPHPLSGRHALAKGPFYDLVEDQSLSRVSKPSLGVWRAHIHVDEEAPEEAYEGVYEVERLQCCGCQASTNKVDVRVEMQPALLYSTPDHTMGQAWSVHRNDERPLGQTFRSVTSNLLTLLLYSFLLLLVTPPTYDDDLRLFTISRQFLQITQIWNVLSAILHNTSTS